MPPVLSVRGGRHVVQATLTAGHGRDVDTGRLGGAGVTVGGGGRVRDEGPDLLTLRAQPAKDVALP